MSKHHGDDWTKAQWHTSQRGVIAVHFAGGDRFYSQSSSLSKGPFRNMLVHHGQPEQMVRKLGFGSFRRFNCDLAIQRVILAYHSLHTDFSAERIAQCRAGFLPTTVRHEPQTALWEVICDFLRTQENRPLA
jgi:hypothetical protein